MKIKIFIILCIFLFLPTKNLSAQEPAKVLIVANTNELQSLEIAEYYRRARNIPPGNICYLRCSLKEIIGRHEFVRDIFHPIKSFLKENNLEDKISYIVTTTGIPLKIRQEGEKGAAFTQNYSSVDSELALLPLKEFEINGPLKNPYYGKDFKLPQGALIYLVTRLDGPDIETIKGLVDKSIAAEKDGLKGKGFFDARGIASGSYQLGDKWIKAAHRHWIKGGYKGYIETTNKLFSKDYPMKEAVIYFGWYANKPKGPFLREDFRFEKGAIAYHIYSGAASTLKSPGDSWVSTFLAKGATVSFGPVYEPYLIGTIDLDIFMDRLLKGYNFAEAAYMATPFLSWQMVFVGDPLYTPFKGK